MSIQRAPPLNSSSGSRYFQNSRPASYGRFNDRSIEEDLKRFHLLKRELIRKGVRIDEHVTTEGLQVASHHLHQSLQRVVRDTLYDGDADDETISSDPPASS